VPWLYTGLYARLASAAPIRARPNKCLRRAEELEIFPVAQTDEPLKKTKKQNALGKDRRRKHRHWQVTVYYADGQKFARVYTDRAKAASFARRQKRSPVVKSTRVVQVG